MRCPSREFLFASIELFYNIVHTHKPDERQKFCEMYSKDLLKANPNLDSHDLSELYCFARDNTASLNLYKKFRDEYLK